MKNLAPIPALGIAPDWRSRRSLINWFEKISPWSMQQAISYNARSDKKNVHNVPPLTSYSPAGVRLNYKAQAQALKCQPWEQTMRDSLGYLMFHDRLSYFWHGQFRKIFLEHPHPLRSMDWEIMTETMAMAVVLGLTDEGVYQGYLVHAALNKSYHLQLSYEENHRVGHAFLLRLFSNWRSDVSHDWPRYGYSEPVYEAILSLWRESDPDILRPWLLAACDRHTHQSKPDTETIFFDFSSLPRTPLEILFLFRLREILGLENPHLEHPLMEAPFDRLPASQSPYIPDGLVVGTLARVRKDWPNYNDVVSLAAISITS